MRIWRDADLHSRWVDTAVMVAVVVAIWRDADMRHRWVDWLLVLFVFVVIFICGCALRFAQTR